MSNEENLAVHEGASIDDAEGRGFSHLLKFKPVKRVSVVLQNEQAECGLACVAMVASHHKIDASLHELRERFPTTGRGMTLAQLMDVSSSVGLVGRPVKVELEDLSQLQLPCVLHWKMKHFVVLVSVGRKSIDIVDPKRGRQRLPISKASEYFTGVALELEPAPRIKRREKPEAVSLRALAGSIGGLGRGLTQVICLALLLEALVLVAPQHMRMTVDQVLPFADVELLHFLGITFIAVLGLKTVVEAMRKWLLIWIATNINIGWTGNVFNQLLRLPLDYFAKRQLGDIVSRFASVAAIQQTLTTNFVVVVIDGLTAAISIALLLYYSPKLTLLVLGFAAMYTLIRVIYLRAYEETTQGQVNVSAIQQSELIESLRGMLTIRLNNKSALRSAKFMNATANVLNMGVVFQRLELIFDAVSSVCTGGQRIAVLWLGGVFALRGDITPGTLVAFVIYSDQFTSRLVKLADYAVQFKLLRFHAERLADIALSSPEKHVESRFQASSSGTSIAFSNVEFSYGYGAPKILDGCSFDIREGEIVAITGASGSGKSTIARLLVGVHDHHGGTISIGGADIRAMGKRAVRDRVATVMQNDQLFAGSIFENISFFDGDASADDVIAAARLANVAEEIERMPMGYQTPVGDMGNTLSGGQVQRVLLARAFYRRPQILVLDEATSQLDVANEMLICEAVRAAGVTTLVIAHRLQTVQAADRILTLQDGRLLGA